MKWKHIKLNYKLGIGFGALIFLLSVISLFAVNGITSMLVQNKDVMEINHLEAGFLKNHEQHFVWLTTLNTIILKQESGHMHLETDDHKCAFGQWYYGNERKQAEKLLPGIKPILDEMEEHHQGLHESAISILNDVNTGDVEAATQSYLNVSLPIIEVLGEHFDNLEDVTLNERVEIEEQFNAQADQTRQRVVLLAVLAIVFSIFFTYAISRSILKPIKKSVAFSEEIAEGNLKAQIDIVQNDEIGILVKSLQKMGHNLEQIIGDIKAGSYNIQHAGQQMSDTSQQISESSTEHASSIEEISSTMEEMAANIQQNADNAKETEKISQNALEGIQDANNKSHDAFQANKMITEKINIITDIAFQTNILALNAAVEAARAGEHGKGFAVVAAEVRKLAERSKVAADEINDLAGKSFELSDSAGKKLDSMVPEIEKTSRLIQEIAASSEEQNNGATQVNQSIQQLNQITQTNAAVAEEMASSAEELSGQSESLLDLVSRFKISNDITNHGGGNDVLNSKLTENVKVQKSMLNNMNTNGNGSGNGKILNTQPKQKGSNKVFINLKNDDSEFERY